jgi:predicted metal-dependent phosphoesterase TrpH
MIPAASPESRPRHLEPITDLADLHTHTTASDGLRSPTELVAEAKAAGLAAIGLTDHDTVEGVAEATAAAGNDLTVIPGIELSATALGAQPHILGYFVDPRSRVLLSALAQFRDQRQERMRRFAVRLTEIGLPVAYEEIAAETGDGSVGRPHLARVLIRHGYVADVAEAFDRYLAKGRPGFVEKDDVTAEACIALIREAGGVAVLAHPFSTGDPVRFAQSLQVVGLIGLEVEYGAYDEGKRATLRDLATRLGLVPTGGSDYHGPAHREHNRLGDGLVPTATVTQLARLAGR